MQGKHISMFFKCSGRIALCLMLCGAGGEATAAPTYESFAEVTSNFGEEAQTGQKTATAVYRTRTSSGSAGALLAPGGMFLYSYNQDSQTRGGASGKVTVTDVVFSRLPGYAHLPTTFSGTVHVTQSTNAPYGDISAAATVSRTDGSPGGGTDSTFIPGEDLDFTIPSFSVGASYSLTLEGSVRTVTGSPDDVFLTLLAGGSPVFLLPEGYTANSVDGQIENTFYVGEVPEPAGLILLSAGALALLRRRPTRDLLV